MADKALKDMAPNEAAQTLKKMTGEELVLIADFTAQKIEHKAGNLYKVKAANIIPAGAGTPSCVVIAQNAKKGTIFAPHTYFGFVGSNDTALEEAAEGMFVFNGADDTSVLFTLFAQKSPNSDTARELYMLYMSEFGEGDIEAFEGMLEALKLTDSESWADTDLVKIQALFEKGLEAIAADAKKPEPTAATSETPPNGKRKPGRPAGSTNKTPATPPTPKTPTKAAVIESIAVDSLVIALVAAILPVRQQYPDTYRAVLDQAADAADAAIEALIGVLSSE